MAVEEMKWVEPDPGRHRRARRKRKNDACQHQDEDRPEQRLVHRPPPCGKRIAFFTGEHGHSQHNGPGFAHWSPMRVSERLMNCRCFEARLRRMGGAQRYPSLSPENDGFRERLNPSYGLEYWSPAFGGDDS